MSDQAPVEVRRKRVSLFRFLQEVREETRKVTWPSRRETAITTAMVFVDGGDRVRFFPACGSADPHCSYVCARNRNLKVQHG